MPPRSCRKEKARKYVRPPRETNTLSTAKARKAHAARGPAAGTQLEQLVVKALDSPTEKPWAPEGQRDYLTEA